MNGILQGPRAKMERFGFLQWKTKFYPGNLTAIAYDAQGNTLANTVIQSAGPPTHLQAWVESAVFAPSGIIECHTVAY